MSEESAILDDWVCERVTIDPNNPWVLHGVRLLAAETQEGRRQYPKPVREQMIPVFERQNIYTDHPDITERGRPLDAPRMYKERVGFVVERTVTDDDKGLIGDIELNPEHPQAKSIKHDFDRKTPRIGISYRGRAKFSGQKMTGVCESIQAVWGLDIVDNPGSGGALRESMESYDQGKEHGEMRAKMDDHAKRLDEHKSMLDSHAGMHVSHVDRLAAHDGIHADHEGRMRSLESSLEQCNAEYESMGGAEQAKVMEQARAKQAEAEVALAAAAKAVSESKAAWKVVPRTPGAFHPPEPRSAPVTTPVTNGDMKLKPFGVK